MKKLLLSLLSGLLAAVIALSLVAWSADNFDTAALPASLGRSTDAAKITGLDQVRLYANGKVVDGSDGARDVITVYGSSELRTDNIPTHPSNFFEENRQDFVVNLVGRGSCQSIIHALSIAASGDSLTGKKVVLITSPQSFVEGGIAPDLFMANFSELQYLTIMEDSSIPGSIKDRLSLRVDELFDEYAASTGKPRQKTASSLMAESVADMNAFEYAVAVPYSAAARWLADVKDGYTTKKLIRSAESEPSSGGSAASGPIDWADQEAKAVDAAMAATDNNDFGILNDYYTTYIGKKLAQQKDKDADLSYSESEEYADLRLLLDVCRLKGIEPLFVHVPLHGDWSDYTGFTADRRAEYYQNVRDIVEQYDNVTMLDLTGSEYEEYFLCDIMHLGWKGWLEVDKALVDYYYAD